MKNLRVPLAVFLLSLAAPLSAQIIRIQTVVSRYIEEDKTELIGARTVTALGTPATVTFKNVAVALLASADADEKSIRINTRLAEKLPDGTTRRHEADSIAIPVGHTQLIRLGDYKLELTPSIAEPLGFTINFPGGTIAQFLAQLPENRGRMAFNLVGEKADLQTEIPPLNLKVSSPGTLVLALNAVLNPKGLAIGQSQSGVTDFSGRDSVYVLQKISEPDATASPASPRLRSYDLSDYLDEKTTVDQITQAIRSAWELRPDNKPEDLRIKFHPGTSLLLVNGPDSAIKTADIVLGSMRSKTRGTNAAFEAGRLESVAEEVRRRRELRQAAATPNDPEVVLLPEFGTFATPPPAAPARPATAAPLMSPEEIQKATDEVRARRDARQKLKPQPSPSTPSPSTPPPPEPPASK
ncbi:hypothetical protein CMV30_16660 [Nibricoccus aquaticus]|uniref:Uncharacterized protein n=1 Tax=Nibricoccus aquaticus TaxID=2576891 RepID=A0A290Q9T1_9BACT|nr:hypothetical protein [Nibricoccus aquaticus]ATC65445.1 hypothetical protein CMV30_16660 [Nibricoccus aquaticus]